MTQSPPQASHSSRPPPPAAAPGADSGRRITALAAGGSVLLVCSAAVALWPRTYGSQATFVVDGGIAADKQVAVASRIEAALLERDVLAAAAMDLPPELRSPDPIGKLRAGIRVQSRGSLGFVVEFRGSDPQSVQRIANRLVDRAVGLLPKVAAAPAQPPSPNVLVLAERTRAVTEFLTAHPEMTLEPSSNPSPNASDSGLDALRTEKRLLEAKLTSGNDNPYNEPNQAPAVLARRLEELKNTIQRREIALKRPRATAPAVSPELTAQWRTLLAELAAAQANANVATPVVTVPAVTGHVTARAPLPGSPLTPNRLVLSLVAALLSVAAAMVAYVLPRKGSARPAAAPGPNPRLRSDPPPAKRSDPPPAPRNESDLAFAATGIAMQPAPRPQSDPPPRPLSSRPPPQLGPSPSEPPPAIAVQRTVVLGPSGASGSERPPPRQRSSTSPGGILAPHSYPPPAEQPAQGGHSPPAPPTFGSRPPPGAGSYSVSSSHPPAGDVGQRAHASVERLSPLQSAHPPMPASPGAAGRQSVDPTAPQIVSRPPALDPEAEKWAARFETVPPPPGPAPEPEQVPRRKKSGRWKTQAMGSMVPIEVSQAREERAPYSDPMSSERPEVRPDQRPEPAVFVHYDQPPQPAASNIVFNDVPSGWRPSVDPGESAILVIRDAVLQHPPVRHLSIAVTGPRAAQRARLAGALSIALAQSGVRVLLLEADFENPQVHQVMSIAAAPGAGFSQQLLARRAGGQPKPWTVVRAAPTLHVLAEGRLRSPGVVGAVDFERAFAELRDQHQVVIVHAPPLERMAELMAFNHLVQCGVIANVTGLPAVRFGEGPLRNLS